MWQFSSHLRPETGEKSSLFEHIVRDTWVQCAAYSHNLDVFTKVPLDPEETLRGPRMDSILAVASSLCLVKILLRTYNNGCEFTLL